MTRPLGFGGLELGAWFAGVFAWWFSVGDFTWWIHGWFELGGLFFWTLVLLEFWFVVGAVWYGTASRALVSLLAFLAFCCVFSDAGYPSWAGIWSFLVRHRWTLLFFASIEVAGVVLWPFKQWRMLAVENLGKLKAIRRIWLKEQGVADRDLPDDAALLPEKYRLAWTHYVFGDPDASPSCTVKKVEHPFGTDMRHRLSRRDGDLYGDFYSATIGDPVAAGFARPPLFRDHLVEIVNWATWWFAYFIIYLFEHFIKEVIEAIMTRLKEVFDGLMAVWYRGVNRDFVFDHAKPEPVAELDEIAGQSPP